LFYTSSKVALRSIPNKKCKENPRFGKGQETKSVAIKGLATKLTPNQPNAMEAQFACLDVLVMNMASNMVTQMKPTTPMLGDFSAQGFNLRFFCGAKLSRPLALVEIQLGLPNDHISGVVGDKTLLKVSITAPIIKASARM
jgi:hypothetical protein